jgi:hypothetical protein
MRSCLGNGRHRGAAGRLPLICCRFSLKLFRMGMAICILVTHFMKHCNQAPGYIVIGPLYFRSVHRKVLDF